MLKYDTFSQSTLAIPSLAIKSPISCGKDPKQNFFWKRILKKIQDIRLNEIKASVTSKNHNMSIKFPQKWFH